MPTINQLSGIDVIVGGDQLALYSGAQSDTRSVTVTTLTNYVADAIIGTQDETIYNLTTVGSGFTVSALPTSVGGSVWAQLTLSATAATGTVILPGVDDRAPGQEVLVTCTQAVTSLTVSGNGAGVLGAPTTLAANGYFRMAYDSISNQWFRVG